MEKYKYIIVMLVYKNMQDLIEAIDSVHNKIKDCKIIVVNAYYDDNTMHAIKTEAETRNCVFLNVENKGYSFGNNVGIDYAKEHFDFDFIIVSNPDILVEKFDDEGIEKYDVIAPKIINAVGKRQNPMIVKENQLSEYLIYKGFTKNNKISFAVGVGINKIIRELYARVNKTQYKIYAAHGSFVLISRKVIDFFDKLYDENMFLFAEESVLAFQMKKNGFSTVYDEKISILHKEDGSMKLSDISVNQELRKSNIYYFEHYRKGRI